ncbi:hypothetical protein MKW92_037808 [Papaver armeniacum]|nr:hypothetical protein MKW92_037808 [Papaver armeniacum]
MNLVCNARSSSSTLLRLLPSIRRYIPSTQQKFSSSQHQSSIYQWNSILKSQSPPLLTVFKQILQLSIKPNDLTFSLLLTNTCSSYSEAQQIHTHLLKCGFHRFVVVGTALLNSYARYGFVSFADQVFEDMPNRDVVSWNALICGYSYNGYDSDALELFCEMLIQGFEPCRVTLVTVIPSCARSGLLFCGKSIHGLGVKVGLDVDSRVQNSLTDMYGKCKDLVSARFLFQKMSDKCIVSWNTMICAYGQSGYFSEAMLVFKQMLQESISANSVTIVSLLSANNSPVDSTHSYVIKTGLDMDASVITSLICMYSRCGQTELAGLLYMLMPQKNLVSLTPIISSYAEKGDVVSAVKCFNEIRLFDLKPDAVVMVSILHGFKSPNCVGLAISFHGYGIKSGLTTDTLVVNGLISMYTKLDNIEAAFSLFRDLRERTLISWNSMISSCVQLGRWNNAVKLFCQMKIDGCNPDPTTIVSLLSGCLQIGSLHTGRGIHSYILRHHLEMEDFVLTALLDMYAKCGSIGCAEKLFWCIKKPCLATWNAMIMGYGTSGFEFEALQLYSEMVNQGQEPDEITFLGVLSSCSHGCLIQEGRRYFRIMREEFGIIPGVQHCASMVDLLSRSGFLDEAVAFIKNMEVEPDSVVWLALLSGCCTYRDVKLAECVAKQILFLGHHNCGGFYVLMSNLYASTDRWNDVARMRKMIKDNGEDGFSGTSLIESDVFKLSQEYVSQLNSE